MVLQAHQGMAYCSHVAASISAEAPGCVRAGNLPGLFYVMEKDVATALVPKCAACLGLLDLGSLALCALADIAFLRLACMLKELVVGLSTRETGCCRMLSLIMVEELALTQP